MLKAFFRTLFLIIFLFAENNIVQEIKLKGLITNPKQEISGMDWFNDKLFFLPENLGGYLFMSTKNEIHEQITSKKGYLEPKKQYLTPLIIQNLSWDLMVLKLSPLMEMKFMLLLRQSKMV